jgi:hypothetical protein
MAIMRPEDDTLLHIGDCFLLCGRFGFNSKLEWGAKNHKAFDYLVTGKEGGQRHTAGTN